jgi:hypothetical protein
MKPTRTTQRQRDRAAAHALAAHVYAIKRARELTPEQAEQAALARLGPVPAVCQECRAVPPITFVVAGSGLWLCATCRDGGHNA